MPRPANSAAKSRCAARLTKIPHRTQHPSVIRIPRTQNIVPSSQSVSLSPQIKLCACLISGPIATELRDTGYKCCCLDFLVVVLRLAGRPWAKNLETNLLSMWSLVGTGLPGRGLPMRSPSWLRPKIGIWARV